MSTTHAPSRTRPWVVALLGNPNTGKSTLFAALAGVRQQIGNYPGCTVEKKVGHAAWEGERFELVDLPGTYSLAPRSPDEMVTVDVLLGRREGQAAPDALLCIVDAGNLERNLYLVSQALEMRLPTVVALNMVDLAASRGLTIDAQRLSERLGVPVVPIQANRRQGLDALRNALAKAVHAPQPNRDGPFPADFNTEVDQLAERLAAASSTSTEGPTPPSADRGESDWPRYLVERLLLDSSGYLVGALLNAPQHAEVREALIAARQRLAKQGLPIPACEAMARYAWAGRMTDGLIHRTPQERASGTDRLDRVLTHRLWGTLIFAGLMFLVFSSIFVVAQPPMDLIDGWFGALGEWVEGRMTAGPLRDLLVTGVIGGVGGVVVFLPQIMFLFFFIGVLEDCGYMARAAYLMDKLMVRVGLSGKSFIPMLSSFACAIPGVMATRVIENRRDRLTTMLVAPLMSCSARLPVYVLMVQAFVPRRGLTGNAWLDKLLSWHGVTLFSLYLLGIVVAAAVALLLKRTILAGPTPPFVLELPTYKWPAPSLVLYRMVERGWEFIRRAGTLILAVSVVIWALMYYPHDTEQVEGPHAARIGQLQAIIDAGQGPSAKEKEDAADELAQLERRIDRAYQRQSWLGRIGHWIEPAVRPLGWDWRIGCAVVASFPAREVVVGTMNVIFDVETVDTEDEDEQRTRLATALQQATWEGSERPLFTLPVALSIMVFFALCAQCAATLAVIKRETNSWRWPIFTFCYMTSLAYLGAFLTYQIGSWLAG